jgi:hypothetical protein
MHPTRLPCAVSSRKSELYFQIRKGNHSYKEETASVRVSFWRVLLDETSEMGSSLTIGMEGNVCQVGRNGPLNRYMLFREAWSRLDVEGYKSNRHTTSITCHCMAEVRRGRRASEWETILLYAVHSNHPMSSEFPNSH